MKAESVKKGTGLFSHCGINIHTRIQQSKDQLLCQINVIKAEPTRGSGGWAYTYTSMNANGKIYFMIQYGVNW